MMKDLEDSGDPLPDSFSGDALSAELGSTCVPQCVSPQLNSHPMSPRSCVQSLPLPVAPQLTAHCVRLPRVRFPSQPCRVVCVVALQHHAVDRPEPPHPHFTLTNHNPRLHLQLKDCKEDCADPGSLGQTVPRRLQAGSGRTAPTLSCSSL